MCLAGGWNPNAAWGQESGKVRLFILSGQSNMSFDEKQDFAAHVEKAFPGERIVVVKHAVGGQPIWHWYKGWKPPANAKPVAGVPDKLGETYDALFAKVAKCGVVPKTVTSVTLVWMQGEAEGRNAVTCTVYDASLKGLIQQFRDDLMRPDLQVVIGRLNDAQMQRESWKMVRKAQETVADRDKHAAWIDSDDLNGDDNNVHNTGAGSKELGRRFAKAAVELIQKKAE
jgi:hypothetical protein